MIKRLTKEKLELIKEIVIEIGLVEMNLLASNKYFELASKIEEKDDIRITEKEANLIFECIYKYIEYKKIRDIGPYLEIIKSIIERG